MSLLLVSPPAEEPVSLADAKAFARIDTDAEDTLVATLIAAARLSVEVRTKRVLITQGWRCFRDHWPPVGHARPAAAADRAGRRGHRL